jgi:hypothetical protein
VLEAQKQRLVENGGDIFDRDDSTALPRLRKMFQVKSIEVIDVARRI